MRTTLYLKQTDLIIQLAAVALPAIEAIYYTDISCLMMAYLALGSAQVISCIINGFALPAGFKHKHRIAYQYVLASIAIVTFAIVAGKSDDQRAFIFYSLMVASPFIAAWYMWLSYKEVKFLKALVMRAQYTRI